MKKLLPLWITLGVLLLLGAAALGLLATATLPCTVEAGEPLPPPAAYGRYSFLPLTGKAETADTAQPGEYPVSLSLWSIPLASTLTVADTTPPTVTPIPQSCFWGESLPADDFVDIRDATACRAAFAAEPDFKAAGEQTVRVAVTDLGGNVTVAEVPLTVHAIAHEITVEAGTTADSLRDMLTELVHGKLVFGDDLAAYDHTRLGEQFLTVTLDGETTKLRLTVTDTLPPDAAPRFVSLLKGETAEPDAFVRGITDATPVTVAFASTPDFSPGARAVALTLTDAAGNQTTLSGLLRVYDAPLALTLECGTDRAAMLETMLAGDDLILDDAAEEALAAAAPGTVELPLITARGTTLTQTVTFVDTTPPTATPQNRTAYVGDTVAPEDFVRDILDATPVTVTFASTPPDTAAPGIAPVTLTLTDAAGNKTTLTATLTVIRDTTPPVLYGVADRTVYIGETVSYRTGVSAWDDRDGSVSVKINSTAVNLRAEGKYAVTYTATDRAGNTAEKTVTFTVRDVNLAAVNDLADGILATILREGMSERERLRAIYDWSVAHLRYTAYPDKTDQVAAAYYGFRNGRGDCFVYFAVTRFLLTRAGVENLEIHRNIPDKPHFWNLVKFEGNWYHLDTCPHYAAHPLTCFLLTDAEVKAYSDNHVADYYSFDASLYPATP